MRTRDKFLKVDTTRRPYFGHDTTS